MKLYPDFAVHPAVRLVIVHNDTHHVAVQQLDQSVAARNNVEGVPVVVLNEGLELIRGTQRPDTPDFLAVWYIINLPPLRMEAAVAFLVNLPRVVLMAIDIRLIALHSPFAFGG